MKKLALVLALTLIGFKIQAQEASGATITLTVENVLSDNGTILAGLHTTDTFMKGLGVINTMAQAKAGEVTLIFENVISGTYAIMVMHDANDNKQMDMENGMPKENYALSGELGYGPPSFEAAKFVVTNQDQEFRIRF